MRPAASRPSSGIVARFTLPVSGLAVTVGQSTGREDLLLLETGADDDAALALAQRLGRTPDDDEIDWATLTPTDLDTLILRLRRTRLGDRIVSDLHCNPGGCGSRIDLAFGIETYLAHHRPKSPGGRRWQVHAVADAPGWFRCDETSSGEGGGPAQFRLPTVADQRRAAHDPDPEAALARACFAPGIGAPFRRRTMAALEAMAPPLSSPLQGRCPECGTVVTAWFDPRRYCLSELRDRARFVYEDVDLLAARYGWSEDGILSLPNARREIYVERALQRAAA